MKLLPGFSIMPPTGTPYSDRKLPEAGIARYQTTFPGVHNYLYFIHHGQPVGFLAHPVFETFDYKNPAIYKEGFYGLAHGSKPSHINYNEKRYPYDVLLQVLPMTPEQEDAVWEYLQPAFEEWRDRRFRIWNNNCRTFAADIFRRAKAFLKVYRDSSAQVADG